jgi:hypothetical protein
MKLRKEVSDKDRENTDALRDLATSYAKLGDVSVQLAGQISAAESRRYFDEARQWYENAVTVLNAIQARTAPTKSDIEELDRIRKEISSLASPR